MRPSELRLKQTGGLGTRHVVLPPDLKQTLAPARRRARRRATALAEKVGLGERLDHRPMQLSGGQQQRVCIARSLVAEPLILLADEPTGALDSKTGQAILELFDDLVADGKTVIMVTHDPTVAHRCQRVVRLHDGRIQSDERNPDYDPKKYKAARLAGATAGAGH